MQENEPLWVDCGSHGKRVASVVCQHLLESTSPVGFVENSSDPNDLQAWCDACERMFVAVDGKTPAFVAFNNRAIVFCVYYAAFKKQHAVT